MPGEEHPSFEKWDRARRELRWWKEAYKAAKEDFGKSHELVEWAKLKLADAKAEYARIVQELK
jgi:hypothetical protein